MPKSAARLRVEPPEEPGHLDQARGRDLHAPPADSSARGDPAIPPDRFTRPPLERADGPSGAAAGIDRGFVLNVATLVPEPGTLPFAAAASLSLRRRRRDLRRG